MRVRIALVSVLLGLTALMFEIDSATADPCDYVVQFPSISADFNRDCVIDESDFFDYFEQWSWGLGEHNPADRDCDGIVTSADAAIFLEHFVMTWHPTAPQCPRDCTDCDD